MPCGTPKPKWPKSKPPYFETQTLSNHEQPADPHRPAVPQCRNCSEPVQFRPSIDYLAPRKIVFETGPEVHHVVIFDTIARVDPNEVNYRILYDEEHTPDQGVISFRAPPTFFVIGFDLNNRPVTNLQVVQNHVPFPIHLLPPLNYRPYDQPPETNTHRGTGRPSPELRNGGHRSIRPSHFGHHMAYEVDGVPGIALPQARIMLSEDVPAQRVKVAVLDCGVDATHPALAGAIHTNLNEIGGNGIDDDGNGYIDDVVGWNFMVDSISRSLNFARYEAHYFTHLYDSLEASGLPIPAWLKNLDMDLTRELAEEAQGYADDAWFYAEVYFDLAIPFHDTFEEYPDNFEQIWYHRKAIGLNRAQRKFLKYLMAEELTLWDFEYYVQQAWNYDKFWTNPDYNPRDPNEPDTGYGNNDASGGYEDHGTHVAGIICGGATDDGGPIGIANGLVDIIPVRMVPDGDELDKDVANAIRYAVDQGASIINMSFGKYVSSDPERVREALRYAAANDVLIVHAAGNEANDIDAFPFYPNPGRYRDVDSVFINVGASTSTHDDLLIAEFSNVGKRRVDLFAPGEDILSLGADHDYIDHSGTSMASRLLRAWRRSCGRTSRNSPRPRSRTSSSTLSMSPSSVCCLQARRRARSHLPSRCPNSAPAAASSTPEMPSSKRGPSARRRQQQRWQQRQRRIPKKRPTLP